MSTHSDILITDRHTHIQTPHVREALPSVAASHDHHDVANQIGSMIPSWTRLSPSRLQLLPPHLLNTGRRTNIQSPQVIECLGAVSTAYTAVVVIATEGIVLVLRLVLRVLL